MTFSQRYLRPGGVTGTGDWRVKGYVVTVTERPVGPSVVAAAEAYLPTLLPAPVRADPTPRVAFSVLHEGADAIWFTVYAWMHGEVVHCRAATAALTEPENLAPAAEPVIGCVWELPALVHERSAWVRHGLQPDVPDVDAYLADLLPEGPVGAP